MVFWRNCWLAMLGSLFSLVLAAPAVGQDAFLAEPWWDSAAVDFPAASDAVQFDASTDSSTCDDGAACACPRWTVQAGAIFLQREGSAALTRAANSPPLFNDEFSTGAGPMIVVGLALNERHAWEAVYFSALDMSTQTSFSSQAGGFSMSTTQYNRFPSSSINLDLNADGVPDAFAGFTDFGDQLAVMRADYSYQTELQNAEFNYVRSWNRFSLLGGFRYLSLHEQFTYTHFSELDSDVESTNNLYGGQLGARWRTPRRMLWLEATCKAGLFGNDARVLPSLYFGPPVPGANVTMTPLAQPSTQHQTAVAFVGDINVSAVLRLTRVFSARAGYNLLWIDRVALARDHAWIHPTDAIAVDGEQFLHGANVGLEANW